MVCGGIEDLRKYLPGPLTAALAGGGGGLPVGKTVLIGDKLWISVFEVVSSEAAEARWESHRDFADLQMVLSGEEYCLLDDGTECVPAGGYDAASDCQFFVHPGAERTAVRLVPGRAVLIAPGEVHAPGIRCGGVTRHLKLVAKIHRELLG